MKMEIAIIRDGMSRRSIMENQKDVISASKMKELDRLTISQLMITSYELMRIAGQRLFETIMEQRLVDISDTIVIVCGCGNNGGDGLVVMEHLHQHGYHVKAFLIDDPETMTSESSMQLQRLKETSISVQPINQNKWDEFINAIDQADVIIDAIFGLGLSRDVQHLPKAIIQTINDAHKKVISIDIPSGLHADTGMIMGVSILATHTLIIGKIKYGNVLFDAMDVSGTCHVVDIGIVDEPTERKRMLLFQHDLLDSYPTRKHNTHKYHYGHVLIIGGSVSMMGSIGLSAHASLRCGVGLVSVATTVSDHAHLRHIPLEIMTPTYHDADSLRSIIEKKSAIAYGMGVSKATQPDYVLPMLLSCKVPLVIDADGLYHLSFMIDTIKANKPIVLTPHMKELSDLLSISMEELIKDPVRHIEKLAEKTNSIVVLKGPCTIIADHQQTVMIQSGNPGLATAGTGDVLSGIIAAMLTKHSDATLATISAIMLFGAAGDRAKNKYGEHSMIASDVIEQLSEIIKKTSS